jgi:type IV pilus assembly protein PilX
MKTMTRLAMKTRRHANPHCRRRSRQQRGAALIVAMILLMVMSLLAITSLRGGIQGERMSSTALDRNLAFQAAEAGLRMGEVAAEKWAQADLSTLSTTTIPASDSVCPVDAPSPQGRYLFPDPDCVAPRWESSPPPTAVATLWHTLASADDVVDEAGFEATSGVPGTAIVLSLAPYYIVELVANNAPCNPGDVASATNCLRFRITAASNLGTTPNDKRAKVVLQSIYATAGGAPTTPTTPTNP